MSKKKINIDISILHDQTVYIVGEVDANYCYWVSKTHLMEREKHAVIFNGILNEDFSLYSNVATVIGLDAFARRENGHRIFINSSPYAEGKLETPFGYHYSDQKLENTGECFARNLILYYKRQLEMAQTRVKDTEYHKILRGYLQRLQEETDFEGIVGLCTILERERYLLLSPVEEIRTLYLECIERIRELYSRYMQKARG